MKFVSKTDVGLRRESNQDFYAVGELNSSVAWAVVCDGMGGAAAGNVASEMAVEIISERIKSLYRDKMSLNSIRNMLVSAITAANIKVYSKSKSSSDFEGMGTTVVAAIVADNVVYVAHAGDSRAYLASDKMCQLTKDHSVVQELIDRGTLAPEDALADPRKNIITRALGVGNDLRIDFAAEDMGENDVLVLCTDGLTNYVDEKTIFELIDKDFDSCAEELVSLANKNGGGDNIKVVPIKN